MNLMELLFGKSRDDEVGRQEWRDAIHENRNAAAQSQAAARLSRRASDKALKAAQCAVEIIEKQHTGRG